jgi:hypothetical protein
MKQLLTLTPIPKKSRVTRNGKPNMPLSENEEFEFRHRAEQEAAVVPKAATAPSPGAQPEDGMSFVGTELAPAEAALSMASGMAAKPISEVAGMTATAMDLISGKNKESDPEGFKNSVRESLTYEPKHPEGKAVAEYNPLSLAGKAIGWGTHQVGDLARGNSTNTLGGMIREGAGNALEEGLNQTLGFVGVKGTKALGEATKAAAEKTGQLSKVNEVRKMAADEGYKVPASQAQGTLINHVKEVVSGGKHASETNASIANQGVTDGLARKMLDLPKDQPITKQNLDQYRSQQGKAYKAIEQWDAPFHATNEFRAALAKIKQTADYLNSRHGAKADAIPINAMLKDLDKPRFKPKDIVDDIQRLDSDARTNLANKDDTTSQKLGKAQREGAKALSELVEKNLHFAGAGDLATAFKTAREKIAQAYTIEGALNQATGEVSAHKLFDAMQSGDMLGSELRKAADFAGNFPHAVKTPSEIGSMPMNMRQMATKPIFHEGAIGSPKQIKVKNPTVQRALRATVGSAVRPTGSDQ